MYPVQFASIINQLKSVDKRKKAKLLVVDDEPDNLDLLYRTFRRDFQVLRAESGIRALEILATEGEVAVIISDQRMPEMKGTEFLSKTVPQFPNTIRIILTGFTDVEDLVDAINSGQVYKYITKPWDPNELKVVVQRATETYELIKTRLEELQQAQTQTELMAKILEIVQQSNSLTNCFQAIATNLGKAFVVNTCVLQLVKDRQLQETKGSYTNQVELLNLEADSLVEKAIATKEIQVWLNSGEPSEYTPKANLALHLIVPISYRNQLIAVLSLQWQQPYQLQESQLKLIQLLGQQIALAINSFLTVNY